MKEYDNLHLKLKLPLLKLIIFVSEETPSDYEVISGGNSYELHKECKKRCDKKKLDFPLTYKDIAEDVELPIYETEKPIRKKQKVAVTYEVCGYVEVEEETMQEAMENFNKNIDYIALPTDIEYVDGSFQLLSNDVEEMEALANC